MDCPPLLFRVHDDSTDRHTPYTPARGFVAGLCRNLSEAELAAVEALKLDADRLASTLKTAHTLSYADWRQLALPFAAPTPTPEIAQAATLGALADYVNTYQAAKRPSALISASVSFAYACWEAHRRRGRAGLCISIIDARALAGRVLSAEAVLAAAPRAPEVARLLTFARGFEEHFVIGAVPPPAVVARVRWDADFVQKLPVWFLADSRTELAVPPGTRARDFYDHWAARGALRLVKRVDAVEQCLSVARYILEDSVFHDEDDPILYDIAEAVFALRPDAARFGELVRHMRGPPAAPVPAAAPPTPPVQGSSAAPGAQAADLNELMNMVKQLSVQVKDMQEQRARTPPPGAAGLPTPPASPERPRRAAGAGTASQSKRVATEPLDEEGRYEKRVTRSMTAVATAKQKQTTGGRPRKRGNTTAL